VLRSGRIAGFSDYVRVMPVVRPSAVMDMDVSHLLGLLATFDSSFYGIFLGTSLQTGSRAYLLIVGIRPPSLDVVSRPRQDNK
jgi:hypothetical protein